MTNAWGHLVPDSRSVVILRAPRSPKCHELAHARARAAMEAA